VIATAETPRGEAGPALAGIADRDSDLLVVGAGSRGALRRAVTVSVSRYCLTRARCAVLTAPPTPLERQLAPTP
jgi:nucleotide-binding universal stress UspA family protein